MNIESLKTIGVIALVIVLLWWGSANRRRRSPEYQREKEIRLQEDIDKRLGGKG